MDAIFGILLIAVCIFGSFALGIIVGVADCKRSYGIGKGVTPEEYDNWLETLADMAYEPYKEVDEDGFYEVNEDGCIYP